MEQSIKRISSGEMVRMLSEGGWAVVSGSLVRELAAQGLGSYTTDLPVVALSVVDETIVKIDTKCRFSEKPSHTFTAPTDDVVLRNEWAIEIYHAFMSRRQRKKIDGGGWDEVPDRRVALKLVNPAIEESVRQAARERMECEKREREQAAAIALEARRREFVTKLRNEYVGKVINGIEVQNGNLYFAFNDGTYMGVTASEDCFEGGEINVNGISLTSFRKEEYDGN